MTRIRVEMPQEKEIRYNQLIPQNYVLFAKLIVIILLQHKFQNHIPKNAPIVGKRNQYNYIQNQNYFCRILLNTLLLSTPKSCS
jgi:hypothetical protein